MGIDIYMRWREQTPAERERQVTGFSIDHGHAGYLRESIGGVHAVTWLMPEAFADDDGSVDNARGWYDGNCEVDFAARITNALATQVGAISGALMEMTEASGGFPPDGYLVEAGRVERIDERWPDEPEVSWRVPVDVLRHRLPLAEALTERRYEGDPEAVKASRESLRGFVALAERLETEGLEPSVYVSY